MNSANDKYGPSLDRPLSPSKPVDPATRLSELLAQSLEELTRPFDAPKGAQPGAHPARPLEPAVAPRAEVVEDAPEEPSDPDQARADADKALAELEAELFAAAKQVDRDESIPHSEPEEEHAQAEHVADEPAEPPPEPVAVAHDSLEADLQKELAALSASKPPRPMAETPPAETVDADAARVIAKVRRLMLVSMAVTIVAVGSVFGFVGYRIFKGEGMVEKRADKLPASAAVAAEVTLSIPRGAKVIQSAVANDRLVLTLEIDGKVEVRTFDVRTLQPTGRLNFSATP
jgi:hypothetical protein